MKVALEGGVNNISNSFVVRVGVKLIERRVDNFYGTTRKKRKMRAGRISSQIKVNDYLMFIFLPMQNHPCLALEAINAAEEKQFECYVHSIMRSY